MTEFAAGRDLVGVGAGLILPDPARVRTSWLVQRWDADATAWTRRRLRLGRPDAAAFAQLGIAPYETTHVDGNLVTTAGWTRLCSLMIAGGGQAPTNTSARLGAGDGAGTAAAGDTDLSASAGSTHRWFQVMDATFPSASANVLTFKATFGTADGNFAWNEFGIDIGTPTVSSGNTVNATLLNHKTSIAQGTKASGQTWAATATLTFT